ncbi:hypothetical protein EUX57_17355 [Pseudomonas orientalis]|uniref:Uncharacterized protein n=1 Tax=Pseudomonas orientalis TaxID=76758 RepID=A0A4Q7CYC7_9PSED|nr:hypothetical protein EUX57_17355 [Pseudomonas orientalis]
MDNFMEQPTYKMNRGAILAQGLRRLAPTAGQMWEGASPRWHRYLHNSMTPNANHDAQRVALDLRRPLKPRGRAQA